MENISQENEQVKEVRPTTGETAGKDKKNLNMFYAGLAGIVVLAVVLTAAVGVFRVYVTQSTDAFTVTVAKILRLPIVKINDKTVPYTAYVNDLKAIKNLAAWQTGQGGGTYADATPEELSDMVLEKLVGGEVINQVAKDMGAVADETQVQSLLQSSVEQFESEDAFLVEVKAMYGWSKEEYIDNALRPTVLQYAIEDKVSNNTEFLKEVKDRMNVVLEELNAGADFAELAKKYNEDNTASQGGDLGWFREDEMDPQFGQVAFSLKPGETSTQPVESYYGLHLIKVEDRRTVDDTDADGKKIKVDEVKARHIFLSYPNASTYLRDKISSAQINVYGRLHNPFEITTEENVDTNVNTEETATTT